MKVTFTTHNHFMFSKSMQVTTSALSLNSGDSFVMVDKDSAVVWHGNMSSENEKKYADMIVSKLSDGKPTTTISEGQEDGDFWEKLGGNSLDCLR